MNRRSLLDYLDDNDGPEPARDARQPSELLHQRLAELESRLAAASRPQTPPQPSADQTFSSQIETILKRPQEQMQRRRVEPAKEPQTAPPRARGELQAPPPVTEVTVPRLEQQPEFTKFVEAVHLIGQAANRFLHEPPRQPMRPRGPDEETLRLAATLKETISTFQALTSDLVNAAAEMRRTAETPKIETELPQQPSRRISREDAELFRLQDELDDLRARLGAMTRGRTRDNY